MSLCMPVCSSLLWHVGTVRDMACLTKIESSQGMGVQMRVYGELVLSFFFFGFPPCLVSEMGSYSELVWRLF